MKYNDDQNVQLGDTVQIGSDANGTVVIDFEFERALPGFEISEWSEIKKGVMINSPQYGLIYFEGMDQDINLLKRG